MRPTALIAALLLISPLAHAEDRAYKLMVGDDAPAITVSKWLQGGPINGFEKGHVYVLDFWAVWCGPCRRSIPHLATITEKYKDKVTLIGFDVWERKVEGVQPFIEKRGDMKYPIALDLVDPGNPDPAKTGSWAHDHGHTSINWLQATGRDKVGIPEMFIVNGDGKIAWIGDPSEVEKPLDEILAGTFDLKASADKYAAMMTRFEQGRVLGKEFDTDMEKKQFDAALAVCDKLLALDPAMFDDYAVQKYSIMLVNQNKPGEAAAYGQKLVMGLLDSDPDELYGLGLTILDPDTKITNRDYDLVIAAQLRAIAITKGSKAAYYGTMAKAYFGKGDKQKAIESIAQGMAVASPDEKESLQKTLDSFNKTK